MARTVLRRLPCCRGALLLTACGGSGATETTTVRLGYFPNVTHAPAIVGDTRGFFATPWARTWTCKSSTSTPGPT